MKTRRHHNNYGAQTVRSGKLAAQVDSMARRLNVPVGALRRIDAHGRLRWMAQAEGWVMVRRPGAMPFTMGIKEWEALPPLPGDDA